VAAPIVVLPRFQAYFSEKRNVKAVASAAEPEWLSRSQTRWRTFWTSSSFGGLSHGRLDINQVEVGAGGRASGR